MHGNRRRPHQNGFRPSPTILAAIITACGGIVAACILQPPRSNENAAPADYAEIRRPPVEVEDSRGNPIGGPDRSAPVSATDTATPPQIPDRTLPTHVARERYPEFALERELEGWADVACDVDTDGFADCRLIDEAPGGYSFGSAAVRIAQNIQFYVARRNGAPVNAPIQVRVYFEFLAETPTIILEPLNNDRANRA